ncbi:MAG TPA: HAD hydrolase-like protein, partial [Campylobacterales bacterium]|nr:HAD hydrolase-like protein [Campylobacterales bacterium]
VFGQRDGYSVKPDTQSALEIAAIFGLKPKEIIFVGDTKTDMLTAKNGGFYAVGETWGFRDREELLAYGADALVEAPSELLKFF